MKHEPKEIVCDTAEQARDVVLKLLKDGLVWASGATCIETHTYNTMKDYERDYGGVTIYVNADGYEGENCITFCYKGYVAHYISKIVSMTYKEFFMASSPDPVIARLKKEGKLKGELI